MPYESLGAHTPISGAITNPGAHAETLEAYRITSCSSSS